MTPASSRPPPVRPAPAGGRASLLQPAEVEHALDLHQPRFRPRLSGRTPRPAEPLRVPPLNTARPCAAARPAACRSRARPSPRRRSAGCTTRSRPAWSRFSLDGRLQPVPARGRTLLVSRQPHFPRAAVPADGYPAAERLLGKPRPLRFVDTLGGVVDLETLADLLGVGQVDLLDMHPHSQPPPARRRHLIFRRFRHSGAPPAIPGAFELIWWVAMLRELLLLSGRGGGR